MYPLGKTMQLKLNLFEESLEKYRRGKGFNQKLLQTGKPKGTFKHGDPHPLVVGLFFRQWNKGKDSLEMWADINAIEKDRIRKREYSRSEKGKAYHASYNREYEKTDKRIKWKADYEKTDAGKKARAKSQLNYSNSENGKNKNAEYRLKNRDKIIKARNEYYKSHNGRVVRAANRVRRRAREKKACAALTEHEEQIIKQIYAYRIRLQNKLGIDFHVDHIVPLSVGGLHHPLNLQVVPARWNESKGNRSTEKWLPNGM